MIISISSAIFVFLIFHTKVEQYKNDFHLDKNDNIFSSGLWKQCFLKSFISLLCYPPGVGGIIHFSYKSTDCRILTWNSIITIISLSKTILVINLIRLVSSYSDETSKSICRNYNVRHGVLFSAKSLMLKVLITEKMSQIEFNTVLAFDINSPFSYDANSKSLIIIPNIINV